MVLVQEVIPFLVKEEYFFFACVAIYISLRHFSSFTRAMKSANLYLASLSALIFGL